MIAIKQYSMPCSLLAYIIIYIWVCPKAQSVIRVPYHLPPCEVRKKRVQPPIPRRRTRLTDILAQIINTKVCKSKYYYLARKLLKKGWTHLAHLWQCIGDEMRHTGDTMLHTYTHIHLVLII